MRSRMRMTLITFWLAFHFAANLSLGDKSDEHEIYAMRYSCNVAIVANDLLQTSLFW